jgi:peptidoglycan hydrolase-like protein with peptidoglycan-binding domain
MNKRILVSETEKNSILKMHESFKNRGVIMEQEEEKEMMVIQKFLNKKYGLNLAPDGHNGPQTEEAIKKFQRDNHLPDDGVAGHDTIGKMKEQGLDKFEEKFLGLF